MTGKTRERGLCELYQEDPESADYKIFGRIAHGDRRGFLKGAGLAAMGAVVGGAIPFHRNMQSGLIPEALAGTSKDFKLKGKDGVTVLNDRPINAETPPPLLDDDVTPNERLFVRNNGTVPEMAEKMDASGWTLTVDGEVNTPLTLTLDDLKNKFTPVKLQMQLECGGNGRAAFNPPAKGNQWTLGAVGNPEWTGVRFADILNAAGLKSSAVYTGHYGMDGHLSGDPDKFPLSRGVPIAKAMNPYSIIAYEMNGGPIPTLNGFPVRTVCPGWPGSTSQKWLKRIWVRDQVHDGTKMTGKAYRVPKYNVEAGEKVPKDAFKIIQSMPVKSLITTHDSGHVVTSGRSLTVGGHAWAGDHVVTAFHVSIDFGATWVTADLGDPPNPYAWQRWTAKLDFPTKGYYEIWARATDSHGATQPFAINWNPKGYLNNSMHRIAVRIEA